MGQQGDNRGRGPGVILIGFISLVECTKMIKKRPFLIVCLQWIVCLSIGVIPFMFAEIGLVVHVSDLNVLINKF